jgi:tRNA modification GTPase
MAMDQMRGVFSQELSLLRSRLLELAALMELELDFAEEDVEFADKRELHSLVDSLLDRIGNLCDSFRMGNVMKKGVPVAIAGVVNAGKSTLLNALLGEEKALVTPVAGTTRDTIEDVMVLDGIPFRFIDTAGLRHIGDVDELSQEHVEKLGVKRSLETIRSASVLMLVLDASRPETYMESLQSGLVNDLSGKLHILFIINKIDLVDNKDVALGHFMNTLRNYAVINNLYSLLDKGFKYSDAYNPVDDAKCADNAAGSTKAGKNAAFRSEGFSVLPISAATNSGIEDVMQALVGMIRPVLDRNAVMLTNLRHYQELSAAGEALHRVARD